MAYKKQPKKDVKELDEVLFFPLQTFGSKFFVFRLIWSSKKSKLRRPRK